MVRANKGRIFIDHKDISRKPMYRRARMGVGYLPQEPSIFRKLTVEENILMLWELMPEIPKKEYEALKSKSVEIDALHDKYLRAHAEFENIKKRLEKEKADFLRGQE